MSFEHNIPPLNTHNTLLPSTRKYEEGKSVGDSLSRDEELSDETIGNSDLLDSIASGKESLTPENLGKLSFTQLEELINTMTDPTHKSEIQNFMFQRYPDKIYKEALSSIGNLSGDPEGNGTALFTSYAANMLGDMFGKIRENLNSQDPNHMSVEDRGVLAQLQGEVSRTEDDIAVKQKQLNQIV